MKISSLTGEPNPNARTIPGKRQPKRHENSDDNTNQQQYSRFEHEPILKCSHGRRKIHRQFSQDPYRCCYSLSMSKNFPEWIQPMAATLTQERFNDSEWIFERKFDGIRLITYKQASRVELFSRNRLPQTIPSLALA